MDFSIQRKFVFASILLILSAGYMYFYFWQPKCPDIDMYSVIKNSGTIHDYVNFLPEPNRDGIINLADAVLQNKINIAFETVSLEGKDWGADPLNSRTWQYLYHSLSHVNHLICAYSVSGDLKYLQKAKDIALGWLNENPRYGAPSSFSWYDAGTSCGAIVMCRLWSYYKDSPIYSEEEGVKLVRGILLHGYILAQDSFYRALSNHGLIQDISLLMVAKSFPNFRDSWLWERLSLDRLEKDVLATVSEDGGHLEHSVGYHLDITELLLKFKKFARDNNIKLPAKLLDRIDKMDDVSFAFIKPNKTLATIGDTDELLFNSAPYPYLTSRISEVYDTNDFVKQFAMAREDTILPDTGYAIFQHKVSEESGGADPNKQFYLFFTGARHSRTHKQFDDLSFLLYAYGKDVLVDPGRYLYQYDDPRRIYITSFAAHNTVCYSGEDKLSRYVSIRKVASDANMSVIEGLRRSADGSSHTRRLIFIKPFLVLIFDKLKASTPRTWHQFFHFAPDAVTRITGDSLTVSDSNNGDYLKISQLYSANYDLKVVKGCEAPLQGWISRQFGEFVAAPAAQFSVDGDEVTFVTAVVLKDANNEFPAVSYSENEGISSILLSSRMSQTSLESTFDRVTLKNNDGVSCDLTLSKNDAKPLIVKQNWKKITNHEKFALQKQSFWILSLICVAAAIVAVIVGTLIVPGKYPAFTNIVGCLLLVLSVASSLYIIWWFLGFYA